MRVEVWAAPDDDALFFALFDLVGAGRHLLAALQAGDAHLFGPQAPRHPGAVEGHVAAAQHDHPLAHGHLVAEVHVPQEVGADQDAFAAAPRDAQLLPLVGAHSHKDGIVALVEQRVERLHPSAGLDLHPRVLDLLDLAVERLPAAAGTRGCRSAACHRPAGSDSNTVTS